MKGHIYIVKLKHRKGYLIGKASDLSYRMGQLCIPSKGSKSFSCFVENIDWTFAEVQRAIDHVKVSNANVPVSQAFFYMITKADFPGIKRICNRPNPF